MKYKRLFSILLTLCLCICVFAVRADASQISGDWKFTVSDGQVVISAYNGNAASVTVPETLNGKKVVEIGYGVFQDKTTLKSVTLPASLERISGSAFRNCTALTSITLPEKLQSVGSAAFYNCTALSEIIVKSKNLNNFYLGTFFDAGKNTASGIAVEFTDTATRIPAYMFDGNPDGYARVKSVKISKSVTEIGGYAFYNCSDLQTVTIHSDSELISIGTSAFYNCTALTSITLPEKLSSLGSTAFSNCTALSEIIINSENIIDCSSSVFPNAGKDTANGLTAEFTDTVTRIPTYMFSCSHDVYARVKNVKINKSVKEIGELAFQNCFDLQTVTIPSGSELTSIGQSAFYNCKALTSITLPEKLKSVGSGAFDGCTGLSEIIVKSKNLDDFGYGTFYYAGQNTKNGITVEFTDTVTRIPVSMFDALGDAHAHVASVKIGKAVKEIGKSAFEDCYDLKSVTFASGSALTTINNYAFADCTSLTEITLPGSLKSVGFCAFDQCTKLSKIVFQGNAPTIDSGAFWGVTAKVYYPSGSSGWKSVRNAYYSGADLTWVAQSGKFSAPNVSSSNVASSGKVKLSWKKIDGASKYEVYRATSKSGTYKKMSTVTGTSYTNSTAEAGKTYYYYVVAVAKDGKKSEKSNIVSRTCDLARPEVSVSNVASSGKNKVSWKKIDGATKYEVYRATSKNGTYSKVKTTTSTAYKDTAAKSGKTYYYKVVAVCSKTAGNSAYSAVKSIKSK